MNSKHIFWLTSFALTLVLNFVLVTHLRKINNSYRPDLSQLYDQASMGRYLSSHWQKNQVAKENIPVYVPTGVFINSIKWLDSQSFYVTGFVWQKYAHASRGLVEPGFVLPEAMNLKQKLTYHFSTEKEDIFGWYFEGQIIQRFDYSKYPFDHKTVRIRLWHSDFSQKVLLVPDFSGYDSTKPSDKFGLDPQIALGGYDILETFFRYNHTRYDSNFGYGPSNSKKEFPELYFNIVLKRHAVDAMIIHILPLILVFILCFFSLQSGTFEEKKREIYNFRYLEVLTQCAALFFVVLLAHIHLRELFTGVGNIYLEYLYVVTYLAIVYVTINSFLVVHAELSNYSAYWIVRYGDDLIPKVLFLPFFSALTLAISIAFF